MSQQPLWLTRLALTRPVTICMLFLSMLVFGVIASRMLPLEKFPGIDIPEMKYIIHFELPKKAEDFTHRNGRTARVNSKGTAYILKGLEEELPEYVKKAKVADIRSQAELKAPHWQTLYISGGRKDKISKGDIAGYFFKQGNISPDQLGVIELKQDCTFVAVPISIAKHLVKNLNNTKLKTKKVRVSII